MKPGGKEAHGGLPVDMADVARRMRFWLTFSMNYEVVLHRDEDGMWVVECPAIPGCISQGTTREEALANIREAIVACLEVRAERGLLSHVELAHVDLRS